MSGNCNNCPMLKAEVLSAQAPLEEIAHNLAEGAMDDQITMGGDIQIEGPDGAIFSHIGDIDGPTAARILDVIDDQKLQIEGTVHRALACDKGPLTLRAAGVQVVLCRRFTDKLPEDERVATDPSELSPVFIQPAQSPPPENA